MWFKNLKLYRLESHWKLTAEKLNELLAKEAFTKAGSSASQSVGWVPPREHDDRLAYNVGKQILCSYRTERKLLPASVINQFLKVRAQEIEDQQGYKPGRKQLRSLKEEVTASLLPRAFSLQKDTLIWIDPVNRWLGMDTSSTSKAEELLSALGKVIYPYPVAQIVLNVSPAIAMMSWMAEDEPPTDFTIDRDAELRAGGDQAVKVRYVKHAIDTDDIQKHVRDGKQCSKLALTWNNRISFILTEGFDIKRIDALDVMSEQNQGDTQTEEDKFDSDLTLMCAEFNLLAKALCEALEAKLDEDKESSHETSASLKAA